MEIKDSPVQSEDDFPFLGVCVLRLTYRFLGGGGNGSVVVVVLVAFRLHPHDTQTSIKGFLLLLLHEPPSFQFCSLVPLSP